MVDFIGIGAPKAATSWIYQCLSEHPEICMSSVKEADYFFDENYQRGPDWYLAHFKHCKKGQIKGEYSPNYLYDKKVAERIKKDFPNAKLIVSLRNPIERFLSAFYFEYALGRHEHLHLHDLSDKRLQRNLLRGCYGKHLQEYFKLFDPEQILILIYEDIEKDPGEFVKHLFRFLGVNESFIPPSVKSKTINVTHLSRTRIRWIKKAYYTLYRKLSKSFLRKPLQALQVGKLTRAILALNDRGEGPGDWRSQVPKETTAALREYFREDVEALEIQLGQILSEWK